jgi:hypothetical protein
VAEPESFSLTASSRSEAFSSRVRHLPAMHPLRDPSLPLKNGLPGQGQQRATVFARDPLTLELANRAFCTNAAPGRIEFPLSPQRPRQASNPALPQPDLSHVPDGSFPVSQGNAA